MLVGFGFIYFTNNEIRNHKQPKKKKPLSYKNFQTFPTLVPTSSDRSPDFPIVYHDKTI